MAGQLHRHAARHARTFEVPHRCPAQVMRNPARTACELARRLERLDERRDVLGPERATAAERDHPAEHARFDLAALFQRFVLPLLGLQQRSQPDSERERPALAVLRRARFEPDLASFEVDLMPFERQDF